MAPLMDTVAPIALIHDIIKRNETEPTPTVGGAYNHAVWQGGLNVASVDLIAMVVSDAGLASTVPEWWNCSPMGCILIGLQPRGGWQIMQRAVQWGTDSWARCFGVKCDMPVLYQYFACTIRNRLEVWDSKDFICPTLGVDGGVEEEKEQPVESSESNVRRRSSVASQPIVNRGTAKKEEDKPKPWLMFDVDTHRSFLVRRPTKLVDGSRGGQAFMCKLLRPAEGQAYSIEEQARMQMLSVLLVAVCLMHRREINFLSHTLEKDFQISQHLGTIFRRLAWGIAVADIFVILFIIAVSYALWNQNIFGQGAPFVIQACSLASWAVGATGLLMLGGNPRVEIGHQGEIPEHVQERIYHIRDGVTHTAPVSEDIEPCPADEECEAGSPATVDVGRLSTDENGNIELSFGFLQASLFTEGQGKCDIPGTALEGICSLDFNLVRTKAWYIGITWFMLHLGASMTLQIAGSKVATVGSEILGVGILIITSIFRGMGISGPEKWMIPNWLMREGASYTVPMLGKYQARASA